ncbi:putative MFS transporter, YNFM family, membrane transport protein [Frankia sp. AiPs1]|uniref:MFS transporter n=1 Tax=Frankia sp. AiPa1 TaxID=573492 RepID=UPI00202B7984|nr:MFS transporter [Frankia sp. AiPa1]MCL9758237.1 MFS transporter [Frankia sp. AiPa1]
MTAVDPQPLRRPGPYEPREPHGQPAQSDVPSDALLLPGSPVLRRLQLAVAAAGLAAFAMLYSTQASLPRIAAAFGVDATLSSLTVSVTTGALAISVLPMSALAERFGPVRVMIVGLVVGCLCVGLGAAAPDFPLFLMSRGAAGIALSSVVAVAMGHIGDRVHPRAAAPAIGMYVSATSLGGLLGRLIPAGLDAHAGWRTAVAAVAGVGALCTIVFAVMVPGGIRAGPARTAAGRGTNGGSTRAADEGSGPGAGSGAGSGATIRRHLRDRGILRLCGVGMALMGGFVATYNYLTYRLTEEPFHLSSATIGLVFCAYLAGTLTSTVAGQLTVRLGRRPVLLGAVAVALSGLALTVPDNLGCVLIGLVVYTAGFFAAHSVASSWIGARAGTGRAEASALYLLGYYLGSSVGGTLIGLAWTAAGWPATVACVAATQLAAALLAPRVELTTSAAA